MFHHNCQYPKVKGISKRDPQNTLVPVSINQAINGRLKSGSRERSDTLVIYENEEEAATDYAKAVFKYRGKEVLAKAREQNSSGPAIDLNDVPPQQLIPKRHTKEGASKYVGVNFHKASNKWIAQIAIEGK